ncbi:putative integral membrane protein [Acanthocheilonema viteae]
MVELDKEFPKKWPFGIIMTAQWFGCFILLVILYCSPYYYSGTSFVFFCAWTIFLVGFLTWIVHLLGFQRQMLNIGQMSAFIPFALLLFVYSLLFFFFFCISALICMISMFSSIGYAASLFFVYLFATLLCLFCAAMCGYMAILLYRSTPNGLLLNLRTVIIEGDKTSTITTATTATSPGVYPQVLFHRK